MSHTSPSTLSRRARASRRAGAAAAIAAIVLGVAPGLAGAQVAAHIGALAPGHGLMPTRTTSNAVVRNDGELRGGTGTDTTGGSAATGVLSYQGGLGNAGVVTGPPKVYVVFWVPHWVPQNTT